MAANTTVIGGLTNFFKPTIDVKPIEFEAKAINDSSMFADLGYVPFVWFNNIQLNVLKSFILTTDSFLPEIELVFLDEYGTFSSKNFPLDNSHLRVFLNSASGYLRNVFLEFKVLTFTKSDFIYRVSGILNIDVMLLRDFSAFPDTTSFELLKTLAQKSKLGFTSNITETNDQMTWINTGFRYTNFIQEEVVAKSYKSDDAFMFSYVDLFYCLNYIDIETQLDLDISTQFGVFNIPISDLGGVLSKNNTQDVSAIYLTNDSSHRDTNQFFEEYTIMNNSTSVSIDQGYNAKVKYYNLLDKEFLIFDIDSITTDNDNNIALKGSFDDKLFFDNNIKNYYEGKIDSDNMHKNYIYAIVQNAHNIKELEKIGLEVTLGSPNFNLYRFQKISVILLNQGPTFINPLLNTRLSGDWLITSIEYTYTQESGLEQKLKLMRRDLGKMSDENYGVKNTTTTAQEIKNKK